MANQGLSNGHHKLASAPGLANQPGLGGGAGLTRSVKPPALSSQSFIIALPIKAGQNVGLLRNRGDFADRFEITRATPPGALNFFVIDSGGQLRISPAGVSGLIARRYRLFINAVNDGGSGSAVITIEVTQSIRGARDANSTRRDERDH
jgi:hypothetical protein